MNIVLTEFDINYISGDNGLPVGAVNQTLRHDGTDWVATDRIKVGVNEYDSSVKEIVIQANTFGIAGDTTGVNPVSIYISSGDYAGTSIVLGLDASTSTGCAIMSVIKEVDTASEVGSIQLSTKLDSAQHFFGVELDEANNCYRISAYSSSLLDKYFTLSPMNISAGYLAGYDDRPVIADASGNMSAPEGVSDSFTTADTPAKTVTVTNGIITSIV